jgi:hypothetical protein
MGTVALCSGMRLLTLEDATDRRSWRSGVVRAARVADE